MTEVKICGITNLDDAMAACENGADALGFVFFQGSPRYVSPESAGKIISDLPRGVTKVGVFVNEEKGVVQRIYDVCGLDMIQFHGDEPVEYCCEFPSRILIRALRSRSAGVLEELGGWSPRAFLVDSGNEAKFGGTGKLSDWDLAGTLARKYPVILAGGLNPKNVGDAIRAVSPAAVDVGSGVESEPGKKDHAKIQEFIAKARTAETSVSCRNIFIP